MQTNNPNSKRRFDPAQQPPPQYRYATAPQQGPQANPPQRNAVPTGNIRGQNGPTRQTQPQLAQQAATQNAVAAAVQQQVQQHHSVAVQQQMGAYGYPATQGPIMVQQYPTTPNQGPIMSYRFATYPQAQPFYITQQNFAGQYIQAPLQHPPHQSHAHHAGYNATYQVAASPQYMQTQTRIPAQMQQAHVPQQHVVSQQHQVHHQGQHHVAPTPTAVHHQGPPHALQHPPPSVPNPIPQSQGRNEVVAPQPERKRKILNIINPNTGQNVLDDAPVPTDSSPSGPATGDSNKPVHAAPADSTSVTVSSGSASSNVALEKAIDTPAHSQFPNNQHQTFPSAGAKPVEEVSISTGNKVEESSPEESLPESGEQNKSIVKANTIRAEFFQKITQASDEGRVSSSSSNQNASQTQQTSQSAPDTSNTQSDTSKLNSTIPVGDETTPEESKDTSLASISPTPLEHYVTPKSARAATPPAVVPIELPQEDLEESIVSVEDEPIVEVEIVDTPQPESATQAEVSAPISDEPLSPVSDIVEDPLAVPEENAKEESFTPEKTPELENSEIDTSDTPVPVEEQQNGTAKLEEGEICPDEEQSPSYESGTEDADEETEFKSKKGGIIKYEREFLLKLEKQPLSRMKVAIEIPDVAKDNTNNAKSHHNPQMSNKSPGNMREPYNMRSSRGPSKPMLGNANQLGIRGGPSPMHMQQWGPGPMLIPPAPPRGQLPKVILDLNTEKVQLHKSANAWKPNVKQRGGANEQDKTEEEVITEDIVKRTRGILNKLTPENFDKLLGKFIQLPLNDMEIRIQEVIKVVFEKAIDEPSFSATYAKMVYTVCKNSPETSKKFRKQILDQCQREFQSSKSDEDELKQAEEKLAAATEDKKEQLKSELEEMKHGMRRRSLGNVRFIGELFKLQMLTPKIMVECVNMLLNIPDEENLECLCKLLSTVGQKLDDNLREQEVKVQHCRANKLDLPKFIPDDKYMDKTFGKLKNLSENKKLSSRIRFALLDVVELRDNGWKPRRDTNAPKTIEEVRRDAIRQEIEEKRQINSLPPSSAGGGPGMDQRGQSGRQQSMGGSQQKKTSDWSTVQSNKSSRFQVKKPDQSGMPVLAPSGGAWGRGQGPPASTTNSHSNNLPPPPKSLLPPRFNRFQGLAMDEPRSNSNVSNNQSPTNFRDPVPPQMMHSQFPPPLRRPSPATSTASSRENSRPVSPKESSPAIAAEEHTADLRETVKNIYEEYLSVRKFDDTLHWINSRFEGERIGVFIEELSRQVGDMSKEEQQKTAGHLVRLLLKHKVVSKSVVIKALAEGVVQDLPDIVIDVPKATTYLGQFLVEIFVEEDDLDWLVLVVDPLLSDDYYANTGEELICNTLQLLKLRRSEEAVQVLFKKTVKKDALQQSVPWLAQLTGESIQSLSKKIIPVLKDSLNSPEGIRQSLQEKSWDLREELTAESFIEAICTLAWTEKKEWDVATLSKLLPILPLPDKQLFPKVWAQAKNYFKRSSIDEEHGEELWTLMSKLNLVDSNE